MFQRSQLARIRRSLGHERESAGEKKCERVCRPNAEWLQSAVRQLV